MTEVAGCVITNDHQEILLIHRNTPRLTQWEVPGGKVEENERSEQTAIREIKEELGVEISNLEKIGETEFKDENDGKLYHYTWFRARKMIGQPSVKEAGHDALEYFSIDKIKGPEFSTNSKKLAKCVIEGKVDLAYGRK